MEVLVSDSLEGRESGRIGQRKAADFLASLYDRWKIPPPPTGKRFQNHPLNIRTNKAYNLQINGESFLFYRDFFYLSGKTDSSVFIHRLISGGYGNADEEYDDFKKQKTTNKLLLISSIQTNSTKLERFQSISLIQRLEKLKEKNPSIVFISDSDVAARIEQLENNPQLIEKFQSLPFRIVFIGEEVTNALFDSSKTSLEQQLLKIDESGHPRPFIVETNIEIAFASNTSDLTGQNVFAYIEGTDLKIN